MHIQKVRVRNFRLLADVELALEPGTTLVVGRNNSGKTSLSEVIRRFLLDPTPRFQLEDFSSCCYDGFLEAFTAKKAGEEDDKVRALLPEIELRILFHYDPAQAELGPLSDFIVDLDPACQEALVVTRYELRDAGIEALFDGLPATAATDEGHKAFFRTLRERIPHLFTARVWAEDPNDASNRKQMTATALRSLLRTGFVNAQRGLGDTTTKEDDVLAGILETLFTTAMSPTAAEDNQRIAQGLQEAVKEIQQRIDSDFSEKLKQLLPALATFGYPGLGGPEIATETTLDVERLLSNHTKVRYAGYRGVLLPESYNGLGVRNLIFILLQIVRFYREFRAESSAPGVYLVFIEEPEAHLHPQMQEVFIRQLSKLAQELSAYEQGGLPWPVQFVVSTHSSHVANAAGFEAIRYFLPTSEDDSTPARHTRVKDLRVGLGGTPPEDKKLLHQYLTLTRCDLFFADKAVLVEGTSERLLLPVVIRKMEDEEPNSPRLSSQYLTIMEVGGAYAHRFFGLLDFLELRALIITDLDSVAGPKNVACQVHTGQTTSNASIKSWFADGSHSPVALLSKTDAERVKDFKRIAYQRPEAPNGPCGRTFEDAFMLANPGKFGIQGSTPDEQADDAWARLEKIKKSEFAMTHAIDDTDWQSPGYILDGLRWLAGHNRPVPSTSIAPSEQMVDSETPESEADRHE